jgi:hypothetical protein
MSGSGALMMSFAPATMEDAAILPAPPAQARRPA